MKSLDSKVKNLFNVPLTSSEIGELDRYENDLNVEKVVVLPSFKLKRNNLNGLSITRCDDTVIKTKSCNPAFCEYQIGCGFMAVKLGVVRDENTLCHLKSALNSLLLETSTFSDCAQRFISRKLFKRNVTVPTRLEESIAPVDRLDTVSAGVEYYLNYIGDPCDFLTNIESFTNGAQNVTDKIDSIWHMLSEQWQNGLFSRLDDDQVYSVTGSHFLDVHFIRESDNVDVGELVVGIHSCGSVFPHLLNNTALDLAIHDRISDDDFMTMVGLMNNLATISRTSFAMRFIRNLKKNIGQFGTEVLIDQSHHDVVMFGTDEYTYYNDSQRMVSDRLAYLPSGYPLSDSYLVKPGANSHKVLHGLSHNLKMPIKRGKIEKSGYGSVHLVEARDTFWNRAFSFRTPRLKERVMPHQRAYGAEEIYQRMCDEDIIQPYAKLQPLLRYHVGRKNEKLWQRIGLV